MLGLDGRKLLLSSANNSLLRRRCKSIAARSPGLLPNASSCGIDCAIGNGLISNSCCGLDQLSVGDLLEAQQLSNLTAVSAIFRRGGFRREIGARREVGAISRTGEVLAFGCR